MAAAPLCDQYARIGVTCAQYSPCGLRCTKCILRQPATSQRPEITKETFEMGTSEAPSAGRYIIDVKQGGGNFVIPYLLLKNREEFMANDKCGVYLAAVIDEAHDTGMITIGEAAYARLRELADLARSAPSEARTRSSSGGRVTHWRSETTDQQR